MANIKCLLFINLCFYCTNIGGKNLKVPTSTHNGNLDIETTTIQPDNDNQLLMITDEIFLTTNQTVRYQQGSSAFLDCKIDNIVNVTVNWLKDGQSLTENRSTLHDDKRYLVPEADPTDWSMEIRYTQKSDAGVYECRVKNPGSAASVFIKLELIEARAKILDGTLKSVKANSPLRIRCILKHSIEAPRYIFWYKGDRMINYDLVNGSVRVGRLGSELIFPKALAEHSGNYSCVPSNAVQASVTVEVQ